MKLTNSTKQKIRALIVDDEPPSRQTMRIMLEGVPEVQVIGECGSGKEALHKVKKLKPDLMFLDVQMPTMNGFDVLESLGPEHLPIVVFVTAYDQYAVKAFETNAIDYILKPFDSTRVKKAVQKVIRLLGSNSPRSSRDKVDSVITRPNGVSRLLVKQHDRVAVLKTDEIDWIGAAGNYIELHMGKKRYLFHMTMNAIHQELDPEKFLRIHRSVIVNINRIKEFEPTLNKDYILYLEDGTKLTLSRSYTNEVMRTLKAGASR